MRFSIYKRGVRCQDSIIISCHGAGRIKINPYNLHPMLPLYYIKYDNLHCNEYNFMDLSHLIITGFLL